MGIVKNHCKNGDHYWEDAYVTPLKVNAEITGYDSVRVHPKRAFVERTFFIQLIKPLARPLTWASRHCSGVSVVLSDRVRPCIRLALPSTWAPSLASTW